MAQVMLLGFLFSKVRILLVKHQTPPKTLETFQKPWAWIFFHFICWVIQSFSLCDSALKQLLNHKDLQNNIPGETQPEKNLNTHTHTQINSNIISKALSKPKCSTERINKRIKTDIEAIKHF